MPKHVIAEMNWVDFETAAATTDLCLVPLGAVEVYGPHLPQGSDGIVADYLSRAVADRVNAFVAPLIPVGWSHALQEFPGTLSVSTEAVRAYAQGITESLIRWGIRRILFVNGHLGNVAPVNAMVQDLKRQYPRCAFAQVDIWRFFMPLARDLSTSDRPEGHAAETNTSVLMAVAPHLVIQGRGKKHTPEKNPYPDIMQYGSYRMQAPEGVIGDPTVGSAETGRQILNRAVERLASFCQSPQFQPRGKVGVE